MKLRNYVILWLFLVLLFTYENLMLNSIPKEGFSGLLKQTIPAFRDLNLSPDPGRPISLFLGWSGLGVMLVTNLYIFRKRFSFMKKLGRLAGWLDFHIFCGLLGPTLIIFHTNFKVRGLVAISFWSMMIVAISGIVGRYFYGQVARVKADFEKDAQAQETALTHYIQTAKMTQVAGLAENLKQGALQFAGGAALLNPEKAGLISIFTFSLIGDIKFIFSLPKSDPGLPKITRSVLKRFAIAKRRAVFFDHFQQYLGYWHSFHLPFAFFMYFVAVIHVVTALLFGVKG